MMFVGWFTLKHGDSEVTIGLSRGGQRQLGWNLEPKGLRADAGIYNNLTRGCVVAKYIGISVQEILDPRRIPVAETIFQFGG